MKKCRNCGVENSDAMRFCIECGMLLEEPPPIIIDLQNNAARVQDNAPPTVIMGSRDTGKRQGFSPKLSKCRNTKTEKLR